MGAEMDSKSKKTFQRQQVAGSNCYKGGNFKDFLSFTYYAIRQKTLVFEPPPEVNPAINCRGQRSALDFYYFRALIYS